MSSSASDAPFEVANLCSNCQKAQFRDDISQLYQSESHLELDREQLPEHRRGRRTGGFLDTEFALTDSYPELPKLWRSSQDGCDFCRFLHEIIVSFDSQDLNTNKMSGCTMSIDISYSWAMLNGDGNEESREFPNGLDAMLINVKFVSSDVESHQAEMRVVCHVESACDFDSVSQWLRLRSRSNQEYCDAESVQWMKQTLDTCIESHEHDVFDHAYMPKRLIDVRPRIPQLTLRGDHESYPCVSTPKYTALSYCWGAGKGQATTTLATLPNRRVGIAETELPLAVRDAIQVTRALGIPFLWVDALCILQDDPSDWAQQCTEMHNIYNSAHITFCAANSRACDEGFLRQTGRIIRFPFQSRRALEIKGSFLIQDKGLVEHFGYLGLNFLLSDKKFSRWNSRGWVFQERILSTRRLMFGGRDLYFLCGQCRQRRGQSAVLGAWDRQVSKYEINQRELFDVHLSWIAFLSEHGSHGISAFTNATDILPALSGLAQLFYDRLKDDYYAGHWSRTLYKSLLWFKADKHLYFEPFWSASFSNPRSETLFIPSWSNLAKGYTMCIYNNLFVDQNGWHDCRSEIHLLHAKVLLASANPFGPLMDCSLRLRGYTLNLSHQEVSILGPRDDDQRFWTTFPLIVYGRCFGVLNFDCKPALHPDGGKCVSEVGFGRFKLLLLMWYDYLVPEATAINSDCGMQNKMRGAEAPATSDDSSDGIRSQQTNIRGSLGEGIVRKGFGLIICPTSNGGEFYRVGMFSPITPRMMKEIPLGDLGGDIRELQSLAQVETVELV